MGRIRAVVTDLDGTFWWGHQELHPSTLPAVADLHAAGIALLVATGRRFASAHRGLAPIGLAGPAVLLSGAVGADLGTGREWLRQAFSPADARTALEVFAAEGEVPVVYVGDARTDVVVPPGCTTGPGHVLTVDDPSPADPAAVVGAGRVVGFGIVGVGEDRGPRLRRIAEALAPVAQAWEGPDHIHGGRTLMVGPPGVSKVDGIAAWCAREGIAPAEVLAVGDGSNDLEMLAWAGRSVAVAGGAAEAAGADHVIPRPQDGGWARILDVPGVR